MQHEKTAPEPTASSTIDFPCSLLSRRVDEKCSIGYEARLSNPVQLHRFLDRIRNLVYILEMLLVSLMSLVVSAISASVAIWAFLEARAARRESIPRPFYQRQGSERIRLYYPAEMALKFGIESVACPSPHELRRLDSLTIEQAANVPLQASRGTRLTYSPAASEINLAVSPYCRMITVRCRLLANPSLWVEHSLGI